jgi:hypothetical protein
MTKCLIRIGKSSARMFFSPETLPKLNDYLWSQIGLDIVVIGSLLVFLLIHMLIYIYYQFKNKSSGDGTRWYSIFSVRAYIREWTDPNTGRIWFYNVNLYYINPYYKHSPCYLRDYEDNYENRAMFIHHQFWTGVFSLVWWIVYDLQFWLPYLW